MHGNNEKVTWSDKSVISEKWSKQSTKKSQCWCLLHVAGLNKKYSLITHIATQNQPSLGSSPKSA